MKAILPWILLSFGGCMSLKSQIVKDAEGNTYATISIGSQTWMKDNLRVSHFQNGDPIGTTMEGLQVCKDQDPVYQWPYDGNDTLTAVHGRLYTWFAVQDKRQICPVGWHVPGDKEWSELRHYYGLDTAFQSMDLNVDTIRLQAYTLQIKQSGFSSNSGGKRTCGGQFTAGTSLWWSSTATETHSKLWNLSFLYGSPLKFYREEYNGYPVRCVQD